MINESINREKGSWKSEPLFFTQIWIIIDSKSSLFVTKCFLKRIKSETFFASIKVTFLDSGNILNHTFSILGKGNFQAFYHTSSMQTKTV